MSEDLYNEKKLFAEIAGGSRESFGIFFRLYNRRLFVFIEGLIHSKADAEEIVQETFIKVWQSSSLLLNIENPGHYVYAIARNKTLNYMRNVARRKQLIDELWASQQDIDDSFEQALYGQETKAMIEQALQRLSPRKQEIFRLSRESGLRHEDIANRLHLSRSRVKNTITEALQYLKAYLEQHAELLVTAFLILTSRLFW